MMTEEDPFLRKTTDYKKCSLCQKGSHRDKDIRKPYVRLQDQGSYQGIEDDIASLQSKNIPLLYGLNVDSINDGSGIANTLLKNKAIFHHSCRDALKKKKKRSTEELAEEEVAFSPKKTRKDFNASFSRNHPRCIKCGKDQEENDEKLISGTSKEIGKSLLDYAIAASEYAVVARLNAASNPEDAVAADVFYHSSCKTELYTLARSKHREKTSASISPSRIQWLEPLVFAQLVAYVKYSSDGVPVKVSELIKLYKDRLKSLSKDNSDCYIHESRFTEKLITSLGQGFSVHKSGRHMIISHDAMTSKILAESSKVSDTEAAKIVEVGMLLHRKYVTQKQETFKGSFSDDCMMNAAPRPLMTLVDILLHGSKSILDDEDVDIKETKRAKMNVVSNICQYICSNSTKYGSTETTQVYHSKDRETPATVYEALKLHSNGRMTGTISVRHKLGTCISAKRTMEIRHDEAKAVCKRWKEDGVVYPTNVLQGTFVVCGSDNVDVSGRVEFHGCASSLTASPTIEKPGTEPRPLSYEFNEEDKIKIPEDFTDVPHVDEYAGDY